MQSQWMPKTPEQRRAQLMEEIGEVLVEMGKCDRFGIDTRFDHTTNKPTTDKYVESNREALIRELLDLRGAIDACLLDLYTKPKPDCRSQFIPATECFKCGNPKNYPNCSCAALPFP